MLVGRHEWRLSRIHSCVSVVFLTFYLRKGTTTKLKLTYVVGGTRNTMSLHFILLFVRISCDEQIFRKKIMMRNALQGNLSILRCCLSAMDLFRLPKDKWLNKKIVEKFIPHRTCLKQKRDSLSFGTFLFPILYLFEKMEHLFKQKCLLFEVSHVTISYIKGYFKTFHA